MEPTPSSAGAFVGSRDAGRAMDSVIGFTGKGFTIIAADQNAGRSIMIFQQDLDKIMHLDSHKLLGVAGDPADTVFEPQYLQKNVELYRLRNGVPLSTHAAANYIRGEKASNLRKKMSQVDMLLGGYDDEAGPSLCARSPGPPTPTASASPFPMRLRASGDMANCLLAPAQVLHRLPVLHAEARQGRARLRRDVHKLVVGCALEARHDGGGGGGADGHVHQGVAHALHDQHAQLADQGGRQGWQYADLGLKPRDS